MNFIAIDFEIANKNMYSACSVGLVFVENNKIVDEKYFLIKPPNLVFDESFSAVHGLTKRDVIGARNFDEVWELIKDYFQSNIIAAHNAQFDMSVLKSSLLYYEIELPKFSYICSIPFSTRACVSSNVGRSLEDRATYFGIDIEQAHNSLHDARVVAQLMIRCMEINKSDSIINYVSAYDVPLNNFSNLNHNENFGKRGESKFANKKLVDITTDAQWFDAAHPFFSKQIVFTGDMASIDRKSAARAANNLGAIIKNGVTRKTDYLVVGVQDPDLVGAKGVSTKEIKAAELIQKGLSIQVINENQFLELLNYKVPPEEQQPISKAEILEKERLEKEEKERIKREREMWWV